MLDRIHNLPITCLYDFSERYKLIKRTGDDLERDKLIEAAYLAIRAIEVGQRGKYLEMRARLAEKINPRANGARIFYDCISRTTRDWNDLILAHTTPEIAADAFMAAEWFDSSDYRTKHIWCRRDRLLWRRNAGKEMLMFRCKRVIKRPDFDDALAKIMMAWNPWIEPQGQAELADEEAKEITHALNEQDNRQRHWSKPSSASETRKADDDLLPSPWLTAAASRSVHQSVMRL